MYDYKEVKTNYGNEIGQTIDAPIKFLDHFDLWDLAVALGIIMIFGVMMYSWWIMILLLIVSLGIVPVIKKHNNRGIFFHWCYRHLGLSLPGLINPGKESKYSD